MSNIFPSEQHRAFLLTTLKTLGVARAEVSFSGGGDSGAIDDVSFITANNCLISTDLSIVWPKESSQFNDEDGWVRVVQDHTMELRQVVEEVTYAALEEVGLDWYNDAGGSGTFTIDLTKSPPAIDLDVSINITNTEDHTFNFSGTGEDE